MKGFYSSRNKLALAPNKKTMDTVTPIKTMKGSLLDEDYVMKEIGKVIELLVNTLEVGNLSGNLSKTLFTYIHCLNQQKLH